MTSIVELGKVLTPENRDEVLPRFFHCSKREAAEVAAVIRPDPAPARREVVTKLRAAPMTTPVLASSPADRAATPEVSRPAETVRRVQPVEPPHANSTPSAPNFLPPEREVTEPLTADLRRLHVTVSRRFLDKLETARAALSHARPGASAEEILEAGLDLLLARDAKKKGQVEKPLAKSRPAKPDRVPAHVRREVWRRDAGRCQWALDSGGICGSTRRPELDHVIPRARGGPSTVDNVRILCQTHNLLAARRVLGDGLMDCFTRAPSKNRAVRGGEPDPPRVTTPLGVLSATGP
jgi:hypothetical protein